MNATLVNYQAQGTAESQRKANDAIHAAQDATPANVRNLYRSWIRWSKGEYLWSWTLK